jgi:hypothetical protein
MLIESVSPACTQLCKYKTCFFSFSLLANDNFFASSKLTELCGFRCMNRALDFSGTVGCKFESTLQNLHYQNDCYRLDIYHLRSIHYLVSLLW